MFKGEFLYFHVSHYLWSFHRITPRRVQLCFLTLFHRGLVLIVKVPSILLFLTVPTLSASLHMADALVPRLVFGYSSDLLSLALYLSCTGLSRTGRSIASFTLLPALFPAWLRMLLTFFAGTLLFNLLSAGPQLFFCQAGFQPPEHTVARGYSFPGAGLCSLC